MSDVRLTARTDPPRTAPQHPGSMTFGGCHGRVVRAMLASVDGWLCVRCRGLNERRIDHCATCGLPRDTAVRRGSAVIRSVHGDGVRAAFARGRTPDASDPGADLVRAADSDPDPDPAPRDTAVVLLWLVLAILALLLYLAATFPAG